MTHTRTGWLCPMILAVALLASAAHAENLMPPPWINQLQGLYTEGHWHPGGNPEWDVQVVGNPNFPGTPSSMQPSVIQAIPVPGVFDNPYVIQFPNWVDDLPLKIGRIQIYWDPSGTGTAQMIDIIGHDGTDTPAGVVIDTQPIFVSPTGGPIIGQYWDFEIRPNPDWEEFRVNLPDGVSPIEIDIHTISLPEPASFAVIALGSFTLLRRRNR